MTFCFLRSYTLPSFLGYLFAWRQALGSICIWPVWSIGIPLLLLLFPQASRHPGTELLSHPLPRFPRIRASVPKVVPLAPRNQLPSLSPFFFNFLLLLCSPLVYTITISIPVGLFMSTLESDGLSVTHASDRTGSPDLRLIHYNDVYHIEYDRLHHSSLPQIEHRLTRAS